VVGRFQGAPPRSGRITTSNRNEREGDDLKRFSLILAVAALGMLVTATSALAVHARPKAATPSTFKLVPAFNTCTGSSPAGMTHGTPLAAPSCSPPVQTSTNLTWADPTRAAPFNTAADGFGTIILKVTCLVNGPPQTTIQVTGPNANPPCANPPPDEIAVKITTTIAKVRCVGGTGQTHGANAGASVPCAPATLYNGMILGSATIKISDHYNNIVPNPPGVDCSDTTTCPATVINLPFTVGAQCAAGDCNTVTSSDLVVADVAKEGKRAVIGLGPINIEDAGLNGGLAGGPACPPTCAQDDAAGIFLTQGLWIP